MRDEMFYRNIIGQLRDKKSPRNESVVFNEFSFVVLECLPFCDSTIHHNKLTWLGGLSKTHQYA